MLLSSSIPLTLQSNGNETAFSDLADQWPKSSLSNHGTTTDTQPRRVSSSAALYRRFSSHERRRAYSAPERLPSMGVSPPRRLLSGRMRKTGSALSGLDLLAVHESWIGTCGTKREKWTRRVSESVRPGNAMITVKGLDENGKRHSAPPSTQSPPKASYISPSTHYFIDPLRVSAPSTPVSATPSLNFSLDKGSPLLPPPPRPQTLEEDEEMDGPCAATPRGDAQIALALPSLSSGFVDEDITASEVERAPARHPRKSVTFSDAGDEIIRTLEETLEKTSRRSQSSWGGFFLIGTPPVVTKPRPTRQVPLPPVRGQAAGKSILRRTSLFTDTIFETELKHGQPRISLSPTMEHNLTQLPCSRSGQNLLSMPSPPKSEPGLGAAARHKDTTVVIHAPSAESDTSSIRSRRSSVSSSLSGNGFENIDLSEQISVTKPIVQTVIVPPSRLRKLNLEEMMGSKAVRHWSMEGVGNWVRRSGVYANGMRHQDPPPSQVPPLPDTVEGLKA